jgi:glycosyltransferase involved in cell wall biosynthesis
MTLDTNIPIYSMDQIKSMPRFDRSVSWLCWAYNEEALIGAYLERAQALLEETVVDYEIVVIDDCSTDQTNAIVARMQKTNPHIRLIRNVQNLDVGLSSRKAIQSAGKEYLFWQTIDWSYDITNLRIFLEMLKTYDVVAGVRRAPVRMADEIRYFKPLLAFFKLFGVKHVTRRSDTVGKAFVSLFNYILVRIFFRMPLSDYQNVVFYPTKMIQSIQYEARSSFANPEGLLKCYWRGASFAEVPISFIPRTAGEAKGTRLKAIKASVWDIFRLWWRWIILGRRGLVDKGTIRRLRPEEWEQEQKKLCNSATILSPENHDMGRVK